MKKFAFAAVLGVLVGGCAGPNGSTGASESMPQSHVAPVTVRAEPESAAGVRSERVVYFEFDSDVVRPEFQPLIESHARNLNQHRNRKLVIEGHADERGGREYNLALGQRRADALRAALRLLGVADEQMETVSFGAEKPLSTGHGESAWSKNRRAELAYR